MISIFGFGNSVWIAFSSSTKKSTLGVIGTWRMSPPAITGP
jgi:hypothetical protein